VKSLTGTESVATPEQADRVPVGADLLRNSLVLIAASVVSVAMSAWVVVSIRDRFQPVMSDVIDVSFPDYPKETDFWMIALWGVLTVVIGFAALSSRHVRRVSDRASIAVLNRPGVTIALLAGLTPFVSAIVGATVLDPVGAVRAALATGVPLLVAGIVLSFGQMRHQAVGDILIALALSTFGVLAVFTTVVVFAPAFWATWNWSWLMGAAVAVTAITILASWASASVRRMNRVGLTAQCAAPALLLVLIAPLGAATTPALIVVVALLMAVAFVFAARHARHQWRTSGSVVITPLTVVIVAVYLMGVLRMPSGGVPVDEYHWGELLVQWDQMTRYGSTPFESFEPTPGLNGFVYGALNQLLGGGAATFERASQVFAAAVSGLSALLAWRLMGVLVALMVTPAIAALAGAAVSDRFALVALAILVLALPRLWGRPVSWLAIWALTVGANMLFIAGNGVAFGLATAPAAVIQLRNAAKSFRAIRPVDVAVAVAALGILVIQAPTLRGVLRFVASQGADNNLAWGFPMLPTLSRLEAGYTVALDSIRAAGWWMGIPIALALLVTNWRRKEHAGVRLLAATTLLLAAVLTPYVFGRIEGSGLSRAGMATILILGLMLPLTTLGERARLTGGFGDLLIRASALMTAAMIALPMGIAYRGLVPIRPVGGPVLAGAEVGLPGIGDDPAPQSAYLLARADLLRTFLRDGDVFLDMSSHPAFYAYAGQPVPVPVAAAWNMTGRREQQAVVEALKTNPPMLVLPETLAPTGPSWIDPQLRAYRVNRWLLESGYTAWESSGTVFLLSPDATDRATDGMRPLTPEEADAVLIGEYARLGPVYRSWGRSWDALEDSFTPIPTTVESLTDAARVSFAAEAPSPDYAKLELVCPAGTSPGPMLAGWQLADGSRRTVRMPLQPGVSLVPLGAYPSWYERAADRLTLTPGEGCTFADPGSIQMLRLTS
jgi:hypothetical protein